MTEIIYEDMVIEHLDFDYEPPCEQDNCDKVAEWKVIWSCCGHVALICEECYQFITSNAERGANFWCHLCGAHGFNPPYSHTERLDKGIGSR